MTPVAWLRDWIARLAGSTPPLVLGESAVTILDVDVSGIDSRRDRAVGIAVLPLLGNAFRVAELSYCSLPATADEPQAAARRACYRTLVDLVGNGPVITFNPAFVQHMLERSLAALDLPPLRCEWIDLGLALEGAFGKEMGQVESLQYWQRRLEVDSVREHAAIADVFAMAQMFEMLVARCEESGLRTLGDLMSAQKSQIWLRGD